MSLDRIRHWIFDLDDTLYPRHSGLMQQIDRRMTDYVSRHLNLDPVPARALQKKFYHHHGTTLRGLMIEYQTDPQHFLDYVHDIDYGILSDHPGLRAAISGLEGDKYIYTNGSARHAGRIISALGIADQFKGIFDIAAGSYIPKPQAGSYQALLERFSIPADQGLILDDLVRNLIPAAKLGLTTVWVESDHSIPKDDPHVGADYMDFIHHRTDDMVSWLKRHAQKIGE